MIFDGNYHHHKLSNWKIGIVVSRFNELITKNLHSESLMTLMKSGISEQNIDTCWVPGAHEIPLALQLLALKKSYHGLLALGCVIKGDTAHFDVVVDAVNQGTLRVMLDQNIPITTGVLATYTLDQALARSQVSSVSNKGREAAIALMELVSLKYSIA